MGQPVKLAMVVLSAAALLGACDRAIVSPSEPADAPARNLPPPDDGGWDGGGGGGGGGGEETTATPFAPPPRPYIYASDLPLYMEGVMGGTWYECGQVTHVFWSLGSTWSEDITRGTTLYVTGVVVPRTRINWGFYNAAGQRVKTHLTQPARDNCVVHHEPEAVSTWDLTPGYYYLYASYNGLEYYYGVESSFGYAMGYVGKYVGVLRIR